MDSPDWESQPGRWAVLCSLWTNVRTTVYCWHEPSLFQWLSTRLHAFIPHAGHWTEPLTKHLTDERVTPRDPHNFISNGSSNKGSMFSLTTAVDDMACFYDAHHWRSPTDKVWDKVCVTVVFWAFQVLLDTGWSPSVVHSLISCCAKGGPDMAFARTLKPTYVWVWVFWVSRAQAWGWFWRMFHKGAGIL